MFGLTRWNSTPGTTSLTIALVLLTLARLGGQVATPPSRAQTDDGTTRSNRTIFPASLAGRWRSAPFELSLTSDLHVSVYGSGARSVRSVSMTIEPSGDGVFRVTNSVRDRRGRLVAATQEIQEVAFSVGDLVEEPGRQRHYATRIVKAERRFADEPSSASSRDGVKLGIYALDTPGAIEVRFDTPEGTGSFWETLRRAGAPAGGNPRP